MKIRFEQRWWNYRFFEFILLGFDVRKWLGLKSITITILNFDMIITWNKSTY